MPRRLAAMLLAAGFGLRLGVAWNTAFTLNADETHQYLEAGYLLFSGHGVVSWEQAYGARFPFLPQVIAWVLRLCHAAGMGEAWLWVGAVELLFCLWSMVVPWAGWRFARLRFGERAALWTLGWLALWWELVVVAHKPHAALVATPLALLVLYLGERERGFTGRDAGNGVLESLVAFGGGFLCVWGIAVRLQYAPAFAYLGCRWWARCGRRPRRGWLAAGAVAGLAAVALMDAQGGFVPQEAWLGWFHSFRLMVGVNLEIEWFYAAREGRMPWRYAVLLCLLSGGLSAA